MLAYNATSDKASYVNFESASLLAEALLQAGAKNFPTAYQEFEEIDRSRWERGVIKTGIHPLRWDAVYLLT